MAMKCDICFKGVQFGQSRTHHPGVAGGRWKKRAPVTKRFFRPNLQQTRILVNGVLKRVTLCTKCLKKIRKQAETKEVAKAPISSVATI